MTYVQVRSSAGPGYHWTAFREHPEADPAGDGRDIIGQGDGFDTADEALDDALAEYPGATEDVEVDG